MKSVFLFSVFFLSQFAQGQNLPQLTSQYILSTEIEMQMGWREETIAYATSAGKARYEELRNSGWECQLKKGWAICKSKNVEAITGAEKVELLKQYNGYEKIILGDAKSAPELIHEAPAYREYRLSQTLDWGNFRWPELKLYVSEDLYKLNLPNAQGQTDEAFTILSDGRLERQTRFTRHVSRWVQDTLIIGLRWNPVLR